MLTLYRRVLLIVYRHVTGCTYTHVDGFSWQYILNLRLKYGFRCGFVCEDDNSYWQIGNLFFLRTDNWFLWRNSTTVFWVLPTALLNWYWSFPVTGHVGFETELLVIFHCMCCHILSSVLIFVHWRLPKTGKLLKSCLGPEAYIILALQGILRQMWMGWYAAVRHC